MKLKNVLEAHGAISQIIAADRENKWVLSSATRIKLAGNLRKTREINEDFTQERNALIEKFGIKMPDGSFRIQPNTEDAAKFFATEKPLYDVEVEFIPSPINQSDLGENQIGIDLLAILMDTGLLVE